MANEIRKVKIKAIDSNDKFFNVTGEDGIKYGVSKDKSPKLSATLATLKVGDEFTGEYFFYKENHYLSDPKENKGGGFKSAPKDKSFEAGIAAAESVGAMYMTKGFTKEAFDTAFDHVYERIMSKVTKPTEGDK